MFVCSVCGQPGGSYCPTVDKEFGVALDEYVHPHCLALRAINEGSQEATTLRTGTRSHSVRGLGGATLSKRTWNPMHRLRIPIGRAHQSNPLTLHRMQTSQRGLFPYLQRKPV